MAFQELNYVHRDLSVGNVYLGADGRGKISDLEYARKLTEASGLEPSEGSPRTVCITSSTMKHDMKLRTLSRAQRLSEHGRSTSAVMHSYLKRRTTKIQPPPESSTTFSTIWSHCGGLSSGLTLSVLAAGTSSRRDGLIVSGFSSASSAAWLKYHWMTGGRLAEEVQGV